MSALSVGFIGAGRVAHIILGGWYRAGLRPAEVIVSDAAAEALARLQGRFPWVRTAANDNESPGRQQVVFLALHPPALVEAKAFARSLRGDAIVVSLAPRLKTARLTELLGGFRRIARCIPNAPSIVNAGFNPVAFAPALEPAEREKVLSLLRPLGACLEVAEDLLEAYAVLTAMGPTYLWFQLRKLQELGLGFGIPDADLGPALGAMVSGAGKTFFEAGLSPDEVIDLIPVKPLEGDEEMIRTAYTTRLTGMYQKLTS
jgi:pyrroline-5-carboxylate reductase